MREDSAFEINHTLRRMGLASLDEAPHLVAQLAMFVRGHAHLRSLLNACDPADRRHMYDCLAPNLRFKPKSLADYMLELAVDAEARQLPTIAADGKLAPFKVPELLSRPEGDDAIATAAACEALAKEHLAVKCHLCMREDVFSAIDKEQAVRALRREGWRHGSVRVDERTDERKEIEICPTCVCKRAPRLHAA